jgi:nitroreductase
VELINALRTTGAVREYETEPVADEVVHRILDTARFAPNGGNRQGWRVVVVQDPDIRRALRDAYLPAWYDYLALLRHGLTPWGVTVDRQEERRALADADDIAREAADSPGGYAQHFDQVPVMLVLLGDLTRLATLDRDADHYTMVGGASLYPFAWSILLAARAEGLAGVMTTMAVRDEPAIKSVLQVPDDVVVAGILTLGRPVHQPTRLKRAPVEEFTTVDRFDGPRFGAR